MQRKLTREQAAQERRVSLRTMDRWISEGTVEVETFMEGQRRRVMVLVDDEDRDSPGRAAPSTELHRDLENASTLATELAMSRERVHGLEEQLGALQQLVESLREQRAHDERRYVEREEGIGQVVEALREQKAAEDKVHEEQIEGLRELIGVLKEQNTLERSRYSQLYHDVVNGTLALPEPHNGHRPWWRFWSLSTL